MGCVKSCQRPHLQAERTPSGSITVAPATVGPRLPMEDPLLAAKAASTRVVCRSDQTVAFGDTRAYSGGGREGGGYREKGAAGKQPTQFF